MVNKVLAAFLVMDGLFVSMGAIMLGFCIIVRQTAFDVPTDGREAARDLLYRTFPFNAGIANAIFTFIAFLITLPGLATGSRTWIKVAGYLVVVDIIFTMAIGLDLWMVTLKMRDNFGAIWNAQDGTVQELMQTAFNCCGYFNSTSPAFITDATCPSPAAAALQQGCVTPVSSFGNTFVDNIFTAVFGMVGIQVLLIMAMTALLKDRKERERYRFIDEKRGVRGSF
ncbi:hypothetical protein SLS62_010548 [Diatrype stigma]|uniref:Tetraspanin n=1 Tax=Diatrype stigma TaxID=117547 RepID=A0AAN9YIA3_9PEZI